MKKRKPILIIDDSLESQKIINTFKENNIEFVEYHIKKFEESCCGELPTTKAPSVIAAEGIFKDQDLILNYINYLKEKQSQETNIDKNKKNADIVKIEDSESAYW